MKKRLSLLMVLVMVVSLLPLSAFAAANSVYTTYDLVASENEEDTKEVSFTLRLPKGQVLKAGNIQLELTNAVASNVRVNDNGLVSLPAGAIDKTSIVFANVAQSDALAEDKLVTFTANLYVPTTGDVLVKVVDNANTGVGNLSEFKLAVVRDAVASNLDIRVKDASKSVSFDGGELSQFEIKGFKVAADEKLVLSVEKDGAKFAADVNTKVYVDGALKSGDDARFVDGKIEISSAALTNAKSIIVVAPKVEGFGRKATEGDIYVDATIYKVNGYDNEATRQNVSSNSVVLGKVVDFNVTLEVVEAGKKEIPSVWGGDEAKVKITVKGPKGSLMAKAIDFKVEGAEIKDVQGNDIVLDGPIKDGEFVVKANGTSFDQKESVSFTATIITDADKDGVATITAAQRGWEQKADLAKVTPKFQVTADATQVKKGERKATADIVLTEGKAGLIKTGQRIAFEFKTRRNYVEFFKTTNVEATNGLKLDLDDVKIVNDNTVLVYRVTRSSSKEPAVITFKDVKVLIDGSATDSAVKLRAGFAKWESDAYNGLTLVDSVDYINVVKEYALGANKSVFTVGAVAYKVDAVEKSLQVAPYIKNGRVMLPIRAVAEALGLTVQWNAATKTATFADATKIAAVVIGSDTIFVNGTPIKLSAPAELVKGTTFVELRSLASAFGVDIRWDAAAKTATVSR